MWNFSQAKEFTANEIESEKRLHFRLASTFEIMTGKSITTSCKEAFCYARAQTLEQIAESLPG